MICLQMAQQATLMQVFWAATDSALTSRHVPAQNHATAATPASSLAAVAMGSTVAEGATRAGTAESLATAAMRSMFVSTPRVVVVMVAVQGASESVVMVVME
jgi:hypothetical protein